MSYWQTQKLRQVADVIDCPHSTPKWSNKGYFVVRNFNLSNGRIVKDKVSYTNEENYNLRIKRATPAQGDIILSREAPIGDLAIIRDELPLCLGQRVVLIKPKTINNKFLLYQMLSPLVQNKFKSASSSGSTVSNYRIPQINSLDLLIPNYNYQQRIGGLIANYDEQIINNEKRIKILEEMAQRLYTEWFIKFKFPGHEKVKMVDNGTEFGLIPEGWEIKMINAIAKVIRGTSYSTEQINDNEGDYYLVNLKSFNRGGGFRFDGVKYFNGNVKNDQLLNQGDIVIAVTDMTTDRAVISRPARIPSIRSTKITFSADVVKIVPEIIPEVFLYYTLLDYRFTETTKNKANGANVLHLKPQAISEYQIIVPTSELLNAFESKCKSIVGLIDNLSERNEKLIKIRDLLIPQLVTGKRELKPL